jgi:hypothetical protein
VPSLFPLSFLQGQLLAYAGVGVVQGSQVAAEWQELNLKVRLHPLYETAAAAAACGAAASCGPVVLLCCWLSGSSSTSR